MTTRRIFVMALGALAPVALLSLLFGNQWVIEALREDDFDYSRGAGQLLMWLQFPRWSFTSSEFDWKFVVAEDVSTLLLFALLPALTLAGARSLEPRRGVFGAVLTGWWASVVAGGLAGAVAGVLLNWAIDYPGELQSRAFFSAVANGACFGLAYGWLAGCGALIGYLITRPRDHAPGQPPAGAYAPGALPQPGAGLPPGGPHPAAMHPHPAQGEGLPPQHPAAVPYVPPPGTPQQPAWGAAPNPQYGAGYLPQQPPAPAAAPAAEAGVPAPAPSPEAASEKAPHTAEPEQADAPPADEAPAGKAEPTDAAPQDGGPSDEAPKTEAPKTDAPPADAAPAEPTMVDRRPDEDDRPLPPPR